MSGEDEQTTPSGSSMADHLKKYRDYITDLKSGQSSGISGAFGRATDLLPPEVMEIRAPVRRKPEQPLELGESVPKPDFDKEYLRQKVETLVQAYADDLEDPVGCVVQTPTGIEEVLSVYVESGERMFMLSDLSIIDEETFLRLLVVPERNDEPDNSIETKTEDQYSDSSVESQETDNKLSGNSTESETDHQSHVTDTDANDENDWASVLEHLSSVEFVDHSSKEFTSGAVNLSVTAPNGALLWQIYYDEDGPELVSMADGGIIKRAEGRSEYIFSKPSATDGAIKFFILTGLVVDPNTGNVYLEANEGAYTAAFFNNGWSIHQYRNHSGDEFYYATEPKRADRAPITAQVRNLNLNLTTGEVSYDTMDSATKITLKSRRL